MNKLSLLLGLALSLPMTASALNVDRFASYTEECGGEESCAEIAAFDANTSRVFITNSEENEIRILELDGNALVAVDTIPATPDIIDAVDLSPYGGGPNSVAVSNGIVAVAVENTDKQANGTVELFDTDGYHIDTIVVGALPDMLTFTPNGQYLLVANEGEPNDDYTVDPVGSVSVIDTSTWTPVHATFDAFNHAKLKDVRIFGQNQSTTPARTATVAEDVEPEYITVSQDSSTAWVSLQENNALAKLDIASATITDIYGLGYKLHRQKKNAFDASNKDGTINIQTWPTYGMYQPDAIASYQRGKATFIITANEGDARDYDGYSEEARVKDLILDPDIFPYAEELQEDENLGRLKTTTSQGDIDGDGDVDQIYSYGARSFSIWNANGKQVFDSGSAFERSQAQALENEANPLFFFNSDEPGVEEENRSDDKGPEPESVTVGELGNNTLAFIGTERTSNIFIYQLNNPRKPEPVGVMNLGQLGDIGPEGLVYIERDANTGWLLVTSEISNTTSLYEIKQ